MADTIAAAFVSHTRNPHMEQTLETAALYALKLAYEPEGSSPLLRDDPAMGDYQREVFALLVRQGDVGAIQLKVNQCLEVALHALGGAHTVMGRELHTLSTAFAGAQTLEHLAEPLAHLTRYLKDIQ